MEMREIALHRGGSEPTAQLVVQLRFKLGTTQIRPSHQRVLLQKPVPSDSQLPEDPSCVARRPTPAEMGGQDNIISWLARHLAKVWRG
ncbi:MAG: hypothetical protein R3C14_53030 [Caldilineaceae bacterium]